MSGFHILGQRQNMIGFTLDGVEAKEPGIQSYGGTDTQLSGAVDAFQEIKVYTTGTPAEIGHSAGGLEAVVYRSGTNQFHGSAEDQYIGKTSDSPLGPRARSGRRILSTTMRFPP